jgi:hypothetical protein
VTALEAVIAYYESQGVGVGGETIFVGTEAALPEPGESPGFLTIVETGGRPPIAIHNAGSLKQPSFQITARHEDYRVATALIDAAFAVSEVSDKLMGDVFFLSMRPNQSPFPQTNDGVGRVRKTFNVNTVHR